MKLWHLVLLTGVLWAGVYLPGLGSVELKGEEARRVVPGRTMLQTGDWVVPRVGGKAYSRKPPLVNWIAAASFSISGVQNEWSARLPTAFAVLALALATAVLVARSIGVREAFFAVLFLLTNIGLMEKGRLAEIEGLYISLTGIAILLWVVSWHRQASPWGRWLWAFLFLGLAFLAKGPPHLIFFYAIVWGLLRASGQSREWKHPAHFAGWVVFAVIVLPWALANQMHNESGNSGDVWLEQMTARLDPRQYDIGSWLRAIPQSLINYLPWVLLVPLWWNPAVEQRWRQRGERSLALFRGLRWGTVLAFLVIVLIPTSRPRFSLPLLVPASVLLGMAVAELRGLKKEAVVRWWRWACFGGGVLLLIASLMVPYLAWPQGALLALLESVVLVGGVFVLLRALRLARGTPSLEKLGFCSAGLAILLGAFYAFAVVPEVNRHDDVRSFGAEVRLATANGRPIVVYKAGYQPFTFYLGAETREVASWNGLGDQLAWILLRTGRWEQERGKLTAKFGKPEFVFDFENPREHDEKKQYLLAGWK
ncbi:MAG: ArnT family glycosyltransferase [Verrucomicrobiales bacterium]